MIPLRLSMRNFMCYTDVHEPLDFAGIHVACLTGDNGHGKSALLDAITWALWGQARARTHDELIHAGRTEMEVQFEFLLDGQHYRVIRKRESRGQGQTVLELGVLANGQSRPLTGDSVAETQRLIQQLLRMSYETFTHSSLVLQGRADSFTTSTPAQRKQVLAEILGLSFYDELESGARERARECQQQAAELQVRVQEADRELARRPELEAERERCERELAGIETGIEQAEERLKIFQVSVSQLEAAETQLRGIEQQLKTAEAERERLEQRLAQIRARLSAAEQTRAREAEILDGYKRFQAARQEAERLNLVLAEHSRLSNEAAARERAVATEQARLEAELRSLTARLQELGQQAEGAAESERELAEARAAVERLADRQEERAALERERQGLSERIGALRAENTQLHETMQDLRDRIDRLADADTCPLCQAELSPDRHEHVTDGYKTEGHKLAERYRANKAEMDIATERSNQLEAQHRSVEALLRQLPSVQQRRANAESALRQAREAEASQTDHAERLRKLRRCLDLGEFAAEARAELAPLNKSLAALSYDRARHEAVRKELEAVCSFEAEHATLEQARGVMEREREAMDEANAGLSRWAEMISEQDRQAMGLRMQVAGLAEKRAAAATAEQELRQRRREREGLAGSLAATQQQLDWCDHQALRRGELLKEIESFRREQGIYADLAVALGKNGVQAMLIDSAIPELEEQAKEVLSLLTDNRMHVKLETQRERRQGGVTETLDIKIGDELGTRNYELYSGGEAFRVNFALRIALSRLLAQRAGARLQMLVIDEGFGSQDIEGRDRLVDAITKIQDDFEKILVITHIPELKDMFPVRIEVTKTPAGSVFALT